LDLRLREEITADEYAEMKKDLVDQKIQLKEKLDDEHSSSTQWLELAENFFDTAYQAREIMEKGTLEEKRNLIQTIGWNLILEDKKLKFSFRKPYDVLLKPQYKESVQGWEESNPQCRFWRAVVYH
jgi:hypothetical protein